MKALFEEFKKFIMRGNVLDLAVGVVIGSAFTAIVNSLVNDIIMPLVTLITGRIDFTQLKIVLGEGDVSSAITYGNFIQNIVTFLITAFAVFCLVKAVNKMSETLQKNKEEKPAAPKGPTTEELLGEIRDLLKEEKK